MICSLNLDQYTLEIEYSYESGDDYHSSGWLDIDIIAGMVEMDEHYDYEMVDMSRDECQAVQDRFGWEIEKKLLGDLRDDN